MSLALHKKREEGERKREGELAKAEKRRSAREKHANNLESTLHRRPKRFEENDVSIRISKQQKETPVVLSTRTLYSHIAIIMEQRWRLAHHHAETNSTPHISPPGFSARPK